MRFMIIVKGNTDTEAGKMPPESLFAEMANHEELVKAGVLLDASGLQPTSRAFASRTREASARLSTGRSLRRRSSSPGTRSSR